jgi:3-hydroxyacyl-CoA dehydrogenase
MEVRIFGVIGAGQMGHGIAQVAAMSGLEVVINDIKDELVQKGLDNIARFLNRSVEKGKINWPSLGSWDSMWTPPVEDREPEPWLSL